MAKPTEPLGIRVRAARPDDRVAVRQLCARIWSDDYIPGVFDEWVTDRRGRLWVAVAGNDVAGIAKLTLFGAGEAWLHALRVDPRFRRRGVAKALLAHRLERAWRSGARVARLDTSQDNVAVRRLMRTHGFRVRGRYGYFARRAGAIDPPRRASRSELDALWRVARRGDGLVHLAYTVRELTKADVATAIRDGRCYAVGPVGDATAVAIAEIHRPGRSGHGHRSRIAIRAIGGTRRGVAELLRSAPGLARRARVSEVGLPARSRLWPALRAARYRRPWSETMLLYERER